MRLSHLSAAAVLVALVAAMFVSLGSVRAVPNVNDRTPEAFGACILDTGNGATNYLLVDDSCTIDIGADHVVTVSDDTIVADPGVDESARGTYAVTALAVGTVTITDTNDEADAATATDEKINIVVLARPTVSISFDDTDNTVKAGTNVVATITTRGFSASHNVTVSVPSTGLVITTADSTAAAEGTGAFNALGSGVTSTQIVVSPDGGAGWPVSAGSSASLGGRSAKVTIRTTGAPNGDYPVSASVTSEDADDETDGSGDTPPTDVFIQRASTTATLTVGDAGKGLASATLSLGTQEDKPTVAETGSDKAGGDGINLVIEAFNSLGEKSNNRDVSTIIVSAIGSNNIAIGTKMSQQGALTFSESSPTSNDVGQKHTVTIEKDTPGTVDVTVTVVGPSGAPMTETITLTFSGDPETHSVSDPGDVLKRENDVYMPAVKAVEADSDANPPVKAVEAKDAVEGGLIFEVTGADEDGNQAALTVAQITPRVLDSDGKPVTSKFTVTEDIKAPGTTSGVVIIRVGTKDGVKLDAGAYTLETKLTGGDTQKTEFAVSGMADSIEASSEQSEPDVGEIVKVTAMIVDAGGNPIADKTKILFTPAGTATLVGLGTTADDNENAVVVESKGGKASARFYVSKGSGVTSVIVTIFGGDNDTHAVVPFNVGGADAAMAEDEPETLGLHCLSSNQGFATYSCGIDASASEIFGLVSGRGATAVHLWNGSAWVRYSVVDGTEVPGSSDFMVAENDILYISN